MNKIIWLFVVLCVSCYPSSLLGQQGTVSANTGFGIIQGYLIGANFNYSQNLNVGIDIGSHLSLAPNLDETLYSISIENNLQFGGMNRFGTKPWYFGQQIMYWVKDMNSAVVKTVSITPTIGVLLAISKHFGVSFDIGPAINFTLDIDRKSQDEVIYNWPIYPNGRIQLVYYF